MITLKTLPQATAQEVFNQVALHLLKQNARSLDSDGKCAYRGEGGLKCAAGCLIADSEYREDMENVLWMCISVVPEKHVLLIQDLQRMHDRYPPDRWKERLATIAFNHNLEF